MEKIEKFVEKFIEDNKLIFIAEGECFKVYLSDNNTVFKIQKQNNNSNQIKEVYYWINFCIENQKSKYIQKINKISKYKFKNNTINIIECEKLEPINIELEKDIKYIFSELISKDFNTLSKDDLKKTIDNIKSSSEFIKYIDDDFFEFFENIFYTIKKIAAYQGDTSFNFDIHYKNIMINPITNKIVIVDCFNCSLYEIE